MSNNQQQGADVRISKPQQLYDSVHGLDEVLARMRALRDRIQGRLPDEIEKSGSVPSVTLAPPQPSLLEVLDGLSNYTFDRTGEAHQLLCELEEMLF